MNTLIDKILDDIHNIGRTDSTLKADDWSVLKKGVKSELLKAIMESLPEPEKVINGVTGRKYPFQQSLPSSDYNQALSDVKAKLRELFGEV